MTKITEKFNFNFIKTYDVSFIIKKINENKNQWFNEIPKDGVYSKYYAIFDSSIYWKPETEKFIVEKISDDEELVELVMPIVKDLEKLHDGIHGEVLITNLRAGSKIKTHMDNGSYLSKIRRHHIPLITADQVDFLVGSEKINMMVGECWEINNNRPHSVKNNSSVDRFHLIIDIMPNKEIGNI
jgi:hypothetical protein